MRRQYEVKYELDRIHNYNDFVKAIGMFGWLLIRRGPEFPILFMDALIEDQEKFSKVFPDRVEIQEFLIILSHESDQNSDSYNIARQIVALVLNAALSASHKDRIFSTSR